MTICIATDTDGRYGHGKTVQDAFDDLETSCGSTRLEEITFYEATEIKVELKAVTHFELAKGAK